MNILNGVAFKLNESIFPKFKGDAFPLIPFKKLRVTIIGKNSYNYFSNISVLPFDFALEVFESMD